jgi:hypothetical protein
MTSGPSKDLPTFTELVIQRISREQAFLAGRKLPWQQGSSKAGKLSGLGRTDQGNGERQWLTAKNIGRQQRVVILRASGHLVYGKVGRETAPTSAL